MGILGTFYGLGLSALAIPLLWHLLNNRQPKTLSISTVRFLESSQLDQSTTLQLKNIPLLLLRFLLILLLLLLIARPYLETKKDQEEKVFIVEKSLLSNPQVVAMMDTVNQSSWQLSVINDSATLYSIQNELLRIQDERLYNEVYYLTQGYWSDFKTANKVWPFSITWFTFPHVYDTTQHIQVGDQFLKLTRNELSSTISIANQPPVSFQNKEIPHVYFDLFYPKNPQERLRIESSIQALESKGLIQVSQNLDSSDIQLRKDSTQVSKWLLENQGSISGVMMKDLIEEGMYNIRVEYAVDPDTLGFEMMQRKPSTVSSSMDISFIVWYLLLFLFLLERWLSHKYELS